MKLNSWSMFIVIRTIRGILLPSFSGPSRLRRMTLPLPCHLVVTPHDVPGTVTVPELLLW